MNILREIFGPSKREMWEQLCREMGAQFVQGGIWKSDKVIAKAGDWTITLDTYTVSTGKSSTTYTRLRAPFVNTDNFRFKIYNQTIFGEMGKALGMQDITIGSDEFDRRFMVKSGDEHKIRLLLQDETLQRLMLAQSDVHLEVKDDEGWFGREFPEGVDELYFQAYGVIKDIHRLKELFDLFAKILDRLCAIGSAYKGGPAFDLEV